MLLRINHRFDPQAVLDRLRTRPFFKLPELLLTACDTILFTAVSDNKASGTAPPRSADAKNTATWPLALQPWHAYRRTELINSACRRPSFSHSANLRASTGGSLSRRRRNSANSRAVAGTNLRSSRQAAGVSMHDTLTGALLVSRSNSQSAAALITFSSLLLYGTKLSYMLGGYPHLARQGAHLRGAWTTCKCMHSFVLRQQHRTRSG